MATSQCLPVTLKATPPWCSEKLQQQSNTCAEDTFATDPSEGSVFPFPGVALHLIWYFEIVMWRAYALRWLRHRHALPPAEFDGRRTAGISGWLGHTTVVAGAHMAALRHDACTVRTDSHGLTETSVICRGGCSWLVPDFQHANAFCCLQLSLGGFISILRKNIREPSESNISAKGCHYLGLSQIAVHSLCDISGMDSIVVWVLAMVIFLNHNWESKQKTKIFLFLNAMATSGNWT